MNQEINQTDSLTQPIMRRVYLIWLSRQILNPFLVESVGLLLVIWYLAAAVSVRDVLSNVRMSWSGLAQVYHFIWSAIANTELMVQLFVLVLIIISCFIARDSWRFIGRSILRRRA